MKVYEIDPTCDPRWAVFLKGHPKASVFHGTAWLKALRKTYGYEPVAFTTSPPSAQLENAIVFCRVNSWITGHRLVSLPFSDHCEPLCDTRADLVPLVEHLQSASNKRGWKHLEIRPVSESFRQLRDGFARGERYLLHLLDLRPDVDCLFRSFDKDSVQRRIRRAERAGLIEECGSSEALLDDFYRLFIITRRRHGLPPTPRSWFQNLLQEHGRLAEIRIAYADREPISAILILRFGNVAYYKYGCSDYAFNRLGATPWLFWRAIQAAKSTGCLEFDMGRTADNHTGLLAFKRNWVSQPRELIYWSFPRGTATLSSEGWKLKAANRVFASMPKSMLKITGRLIYRHIG